ncbi:conserved hypothetical protein [Shewanella sediminis HAW-EB3]|uniref:Calcineurin-like phosphoesterase domain-containing protein n=1 Tax=Shewanella sediminis (strain HAW-EB3) TaxID=425104 RepID=A8FVK6_SHESH|nr:metallophosphoesterase [Shewanella sediminis]ABV36879.1 conserved hypothetical protein [Shewanella sediminis HAW-EB3]
MIKITKDETDGLIFIGDLHGQYQKLIDLLEQLDFNLDDSSSNAEFSKLVFMGDLIDNKPENAVQQVETLELVKSLVDSGHAYCLLGNHEFNAVCWASAHPLTDEPLRTHSVNNYKQHQVFLDTVTENSRLHMKWIEWFKTLPLFIDFGDVRAVHACWDDVAIQRVLPYLDGDHALQHNVWFKAADKKHELYSLVETLLKGPEIALPKGYSFKDKTGTERHHIRVRWWIINAITYKDIAQVQASAVENIPSIALPVAFLNKPQTIPVVIGHYTLNNEPGPLNAKVACVDYNAASEDGDLIAYYWSRYDEAFTACGFYCHRDLDLHEKSSYELMKDDYEKVIESFNHGGEYSALEESFAVKVDNILLQEWDPIGVNGVEECRDEYYFAIYDITLLGIYGSIEQLKSHLEFLEVHYILSDREDVRERCGRVAHLINKMAEQTRSNTNINVIPMRYGC